MEVNESLANRIRPALGQNEEVVYCTNRDIVVLLTPTITTLLWTIIGTLVAYSLLDLVGGAFSKAVIIAMVGLWGRWLAIPFLNYRHEILALTKGARGGAKAYYKRGYWLRQLIPLKISNLVATPIRQNRAYYQTLLNVGDLRLDAFGTDDDIYFMDSPRPIEIVQLANQLGKD